MQDIVKHLPRCSKDFYVHDHWLSYPFIFMDLLEVVDGHQSTGKNTYISWIFVGMNNVIAEFSKNVRYQCLQFFFCMTASLTNSYDYTKLLKKKHPYIIKATVI